MAPLPGFPGGGRFSSALLLLFSSLSRVQGDCTHLNVPNAILRSGDPKDSYPAGSVLRYRCIPGYEPIPGENLSLTCLDTSRWSTENPKFCQGRRCTAINLENGRIVIPSAMKLGDEITLGCYEGYTLIGERRLRCVLVGDKVDWHTRPPFCNRIRCYPPANIEHGSHSGQPFEEFQYGSSVTYTCKQNFSLIGSTTSTCSASLTGTVGVWLPAPPKCKVIRCREPEIENGRVTTKPQLIYTYGDRAEFECNPGYIMVGSSTCKCGPDHGWIPRFPKCVKGGPNGGGGGGGGEGGGGGGGGGGGTGGDDAGGDAGGEDVVEPGQGTGGGPQTTLPPDVIIGSDNTPIIIGCILAVLILAALGAVFWKYRSSMKTGEPEAPTGPAEFNEAELEPKGSQLPE